MPQRHPACCGQVSHQEKIKIKKWRSALGHEILMSPIFNLKRVFIRTIVLFFFFFMFEPFRVNAFQLDNTQITAMTRYNYYTHEDSGLMMLRFPRSIRNRTIVLDLLYRGEKVVESVSLKADERVLVPFPLDSLRLGVNEMSCCFSLPAPI